LGDAAVWWLTIELIGLAAFPITFALLRFLPDRGYSVTKVVGLVLMTYLLWFGATIHLVPNQRLSIVVILSLITAASGLLALRNRSEISAFLRQRWTHLAFADALFTTVFLVCLVLRALAADSLAGGNDNRWQIAFVNIILRSDYFPPEDPWLAGYSINYYYYGFIIVAALTKLTGIASEITFNLTIALMPALAVSGMFGLVYNSLIDRGKQPWVLTCGVFAGIFLVFMSNIEALFELMAIHGLGTQGFFEALDVHGLGVTRESSEWFPTEGAWLFRSINFSGNRFDNVFPFFDILLPIGYLSARNMAIPILLLLFAATLNIWRSDSSHLQRFGRADAVALGFVSLVLGALIAAHSWDFPTASALIFLTLLTRNYWIEGRLRLVVATRTILVWALIVAVAGLFYLPSFFYASGQFGGILVLPAEVASEPHHLLYLWLPLFWLTACLALFGLRGVRLDGPAAWVAVGIPLLLIASWATLRVVDTSFSQVAEDIDVRGVAWISVAVLVSLIALVASALLLQIAAVPVERREPPLVFALVCASIALLLIMGVEFFYVDEPTGRGGHVTLDFATVLRVNFQAWLLLSLAGAIGVYYVGRHWSSTRLVSRVARTTWAVVTVAFVSAGLLFPVMTGFFFEDMIVRDLRWGRHLDGLAYVRRIQPDEYEAIQYLKNDVKGTPVIMEAVTDSYQAGGRISAFTGLPTILGWVTQEYYFRGSYEPWTHRREEVARAYQTSSPEEAAEILSKYDVEYVFVGRTETQQYGELGVDKFDRFMDVVFQKDEVTIYKARADASTD
jgi:YYY domain-containing protein